MDTISKIERSRIMASVKSGGNKSTEIHFISILKKADIKGWRRKYPLAGNPDFVFPKHRIAIFIDGCFWHGCPKHCRMPKSNEEYWNNKIHRNKGRDEKVTSVLRKRGWIVARFWEHELKNTVPNKKINMLKKLCSL